MKLLTKALEKKFEKYPLYSQDGKGGDAKVIAKFFSPVGAATWLITEGSKEAEGTEYEDYTMFGFCNLGDNEMAELGYVSLNELQSIKLPYGLTIERDRYYDNLDINLRDACQQEFGFVPDILCEKIEVDVLQLKSNEENRFKAYSGLDELKNMNLSVSAYDYKSVYQVIEDYTDEMKADVSNYLEELFTRFNTGKQPVGYEGHSLSVSDVIVLRNKSDNITRAFYCDTFGFEILPDSFIQEYKELPKFNLAERIVEYADQHPDTYDYFSDNLTVLDDKDKKVKQVVTELNDERTCESLLNVITDHQAEISIDLQEMKTQGSVYPDVEYYKEQEINKLEGLIDDLYTHTETLDTVELENENDKDITDDE